ncbi:MAG: NUDIX domain-containing protein [bacterium]|nr:NUDIX domain-containing protein [bacterium]
MQRTPRKSTRRSISSRQGINRRKQERPRVEVSAGGIVYKRTRSGLYFAMVKDSYGKWTFPKGHVRRGESYENAARREVSEEVGLRNLRMKASLDHIDIWFRDRFVFKGRLIHKYIYYYLFEAPYYARVKRPKLQEKGERIYEVKWTPVEDVVEKSSYKDMRPILTKALEIMKSKGTLDES